MRYFKTDKHSSLQDKTVFKEIHGKLAKVGLLLSLACPAIRRDGSRTLTATPKRIGVLATG
ncbi:MAG: hypothetical protein CMM35_04260 [Rhodospirillaceae bacterium]|nr:hypothetical protein [Rhodospirillaceae bacterium]